jgi:hypothetical protein
VKRSYLLPSWAAAAVLAASISQAEEWLDRVDELLTVSSWNDRVRTRMSGLIDVEGYHFDSDPPGLIDTSREFLAVPRLTLMLDSQLGSKAYFFAQTRVDRGFDPGDFGWRHRFEEYAIRLTPDEDQRFSLQLGKASSVVGNWIPRHLSWDNPFINAPLPYESVTRVYDREAPHSPHQFLHGSPEAKYEYIPGIWGPVYTTGGSLAYKTGDFDFAAEIKNATLSSRPESWDGIETGFDHPSFAGRIGYRPDPRWNFGVSASSGPYFQPEAQSSLSSSDRYSNYQQTVVGQDIGFAWHHWQVWAEAYEMRFDVPNVGNADLLTYYIETKYRFTPRFFAALRWNQQYFATVPDGIGGYERWGETLWCAELALGFRLTAHAQLKLQYSLQRSHEENHESSNTLAGQFTIRF